MKKLILIFLLIPHICLGQTAIQNRNIKQPPECKLFISANEPLIKDAATAKTITPYAGAAISTVKVRNGKFSMYFDGVGDCYYLDDSADWYLGANKWTIDFWYYTAAPSTTMVPCGQYADTTHYNYWPLFYNSKYEYDFKPADVSHAPFASSPTIANGVWTHLALVCESATGAPHKLYIGGNYVGAYPGTSEYPDTASSMKVGAARVDAYTFNGYISDFRLIKGIALWTANFTPPRRSGAF